MFLFQHPPELEVYEAQIIGALLKGIIHGLIKQCLQKSILEHTFCAITAYATSHHSPCIVNTQLINYSNFTKTPRWILVHQSF